MEVSPVVLSVSAVLLLAVIVTLLVRRSGLKVPHAIACVLLGFYLAGSSMAPTIDDFSTSVSDMISDLSF
jgi:Ca2+/Na+ antiporter